MKFLRRSDLCFSKRLEIALLSLYYQGCYGKMSELASYYQISRTFLYQLQSLVLCQLELALSVSLDIESEESSLDKLILLLRLEGRCSLSSISHILKALGSTPNSVGYLSQYFEQLGRQLSSTLVFGHSLWVFYLSDEIFSNQVPLLMTIDAQSTAILKLEKASDRSIESWSEHYRDLKDHEFIPLGMSSDRGQGIVFGYSSVHDEATWVCDYFHEFRDLFHLAHHLERKAYKAISALDEAARVFNNAKSLTNLEKRLRTYEDLELQCETAIDTYDQLNFCLQELREVLQLTSSKGDFKTKTEVQAQLRVLLELMEDIPTSQIRPIIQTLKNHLSEILRPFESLEKAYQELLQFMSKPELQGLLIAWHHEHLVHQSRGKKKAFHLKEKQFWFQVCQAQQEERFQENWDQVIDTMGKVIRASSLVEMVNSILRPYLNQSKGQITQEMLNLIQFYHNHRKYKSGKRKGYAPIELLTGNPLKQHWTDLLMNMKQTKTN